MGLYCLRNRKCWYTGICNSYDYRVTFSYCIDPISGIIWINTSNLIDRGPSCCSLANSNLC